MRRIKKYIPTVPFILILISLIALFIMLLSARCVSAADAVNSTVGSLMRRFLSAISYIFPFSLFEVLALLAIPLLVAAIVLVLRSKPTLVRFVRSAVSLVSVIGIVFTSYVFTLGVAYRTTPLSEKMGLDATADISAEELYGVTLLVRDKVNLLAKEIIYEDGQSRSGYTLDRISELVCLGYDRVEKEHSLLKNFKSRAKPIRFSGIMTDAGITGIYSFFTGEANINMAYPDYCLPFTVAHELAHQRGFAREDEANFMAYLACISSDDAYIQYSGYLNLYEYLSSAMYNASPELYKSVREGLDGGARGDSLAASAVTKAHSGTALGELADKANDAYLQMNGTAGTVSYGYVVRLAVAYYR